MASALEELGLDPRNATKEQLQQRFRLLCKVHHPDHGGDPSAFINLKRTYNDALFELNQQKCPACNGKGHINKSAGFISVKIPCSVCNGSGKRVRTC